MTQSPAPAQSASTPESSPAGLLYGLGAYALWGLMPLYFATLAPAQGIEVVAARIIFSLIFCLILVTVFHSWKDIRYILSDRRSLARLGIASTLVCANWLIYVLAVLSHRSLEAALGYFINPIIPVLLGVLLLKERLRPLQWAAIGLGAAAVVVLTVGYGKPPWISLALAVTFGLYGFTKKGLRRGTTAIASLTVETAILAPLSLVLLVAMRAGSGVSWLGTPTLLEFGPRHFWLMAAGGVITAVPLILFGAAASRLPLSTVGMLQYLAPVMQFLVGYLVFHEEMSTTRWIGFGLIWVALVVLTVDMLVRANRGRVLRKSA